MHHKIGFIAVLAISVLACWIFATSRVAISSDSMWSVPLAKSVLSDGDLWLDEYRRVAESRNKYGLRIKRDRPVSHLYSFFPFGTAFLISPAIWIYEQSPLFFCNLLPRADCNIDSSAFAQRVLLEKVLASIIVTLTGLCLFIASRRVATDAAALAATLSFYFLSSSWSIVSRGLWQHGPSMLMLSCTLVLLTAPKTVSFAGLALGWAYLIRPTNAISVATTGVFIFVTKGLNTSWKYLVLVGIPVLVLVCWSYTNLGKLLPGYYSGNRLSIGLQVFHGIAVNLISPSRGLLWFTPILILCLVPGSRSIFNTPLNRTAIASIILHLLAVSAFPEWWAGHSFGPRYMTDMLPYMFFIFAQQISSMKCQSLSLKLTVAILVFISFIIHMRGANNLSLWMWNRFPQEIASHPDRVWNIRDSQLVRSLLR